MYFKARRICETNMTSAWKMIINRSYLVQEILDVIITQGLSWINDAMQVSLHKVWNNIDVFEMSQRRGRQKIDNCDDLE